MKLIFAIFLFSFIAIAVFGFIAADYNNHNRCIVAIAQGSSLCHNSTLDFLVFHLGTLKSFSLAILNLSLAAIVFAVLSIILLFFAPRLKNHELSLFGEKIVNRIFDRFSPPIKLKFSHWLALREKRDPSFIL